MLSHVGREWKAMADLRGTTLTWVYITKIILRHQENSSVYANRCRPGPITDVVGEYWNCSNPVSRFIPVGRHLININSSPRVSPSIKSLLQLVKLVDWVLFLNNCCIPRVAPLYLFEIKGTAPRFSSLVIGAVFKLSITIRSQAYGRSQEVPTINACCYIQQYYHAAPVEFPTSLAPLCAGLVYETTPAGLGAITIRQPPPLPPVDDRQLRMHMVLRMAYFSTVTDLSRSPQSSRWKER
ncbi:hypothetical protein EDD15DRAFT_1653836 [Pisolithus albus]|nr:hypothetical protein EDD15DRAFT_1653836 [Pisolithus albus]